MRDYNKVNKKGEKGKFVSLLVTNDDFDALDKIADDTKRAKAWHLRQALNDYLKKFQ